MAGDDGPSLLSSLRRRPHTALAILGVALAAALSWPGARPAEIFPDTASYLRWPVGFFVEGVEVSGARPMAYALLLDLLGTGPALVLFQWVLSVGCWCGLGWSLARGPGVLMVGLLGCSSAIAGWTTAALTESVSISLLAAGVALGLEVARAPSMPRLAAWCLVVVPFAFVRDANLVVVPFVCMPLLARPTRGTSAALAVALLAFVAAWADAVVEQRARVNTHVSMLHRVRPSPEARQWFEARGMPRAVLEEQSAQNIAALHAWLAEDGVSSYRRWALSQPRFYLETRRELARTEQSRKVGRGYGQEPPGASSAVGRALGDALHWMLMPPFVLWLGLLALPAIDIWRNQRVGVAGLWASTGVVASYFAAFASYVSDPMEVARHLVGAYTIYCLATLLGLYAINDMVRRRGPAVRWRRPRPHATQRGANGQA